jgi:hypothetical protein
LLISLLIVGVGVTSALGLTRARAHKPPSAVSITVPKALQPALRALRQRMLKPLQAKPSVVRVPAPTQPPLEGYSCPAAAGSPCGKRPCTVYASPGNGRFALAVPLRSAPCAKALAHAIPAMAR